MSRLSTRCLPIVGCIWVVHGLSSPVGIHAHCRKNRWLSECEAVYTPVQSVMASETAPPGYGVPAPHSTAAPHSIAPSPLSYWPPAKASDCPILHSSMLVTRPIGLELHPSGPPHCWSHLSTLWLARWTPTWLKPDAPSPCWYPVDPWPARAPYPLPADSLDPHSVDSLTRA